LSRSQRSRSSSSRVSSGSRSSEDSLGISTPKILLTEPGSGGKGSVTNRSNCDEDHIFGISALHRCQVRRSSPDLHDMKVLSPPPGSLSAGPAVVVHLRRVRRSDFQARQLADYLHSKWVQRCHPVADRRTRTGDVDDQRAPRDSGQAPRQPRIGDARRQPRRP
jgi:hypothetical protein